MQRIRSSSVCFDRVGKWPAKWTCIGVIGLGVVTLLFGCGGSDNQQEPTANGPSGGAGTSTTLPPNPNELPVLTSGSRLQARYLELDDGTKLLEKWFDKKLELLCSFVQVGPDKWRCFPERLGEPSATYLESSCQIPIGVAPDARGLPFVAVWSQTEKVCNGVPMLSLHRAVPIDQPVAFYQDRAPFFRTPPEGADPAAMGSVTSGPTCVVATPPSFSGGGERAIVLQDTYFEAGETVGVETLVGATTQALTTPAGFPYLALNAEDGARSWLAADKDLCARSNESATLARLQQLATQPVTERQSLTLGTGRVTVKYELVPASGDGVIYLSLSPPIYSDTQRNQPCKLQPLLNDYLLCIPSGGFSGCRFDVDWPSSLFTDAKCTSSIAKKESNDSSGMCTESRRGRVYQTGKKLTFTGVEPVYELDSDGVCRSIPATDSSYPKSNESYTYVEITEIYPTNLLPAVVRKTDGGTP